jgi:3',5'-cyclic AMP phosphodiesterase CpdA
MRVLHCSDFHLLPRMRSVPVSDWLSKRVTGAFNFWWERKGQFALTPRKLERLAEFARAQAVDAILCTGDFTLWGTEEELRNARQAVQPLIDASNTFVTLPGNHDIYTQRVVDEQRFERHFGDLLHSDVPEAVVDGPWPLVRFLGKDAAVIAVNSSIPQRVPWKAGGRISGRQLEALRSLIGNPGMERRFVFVMTHHAPRLPDGSHDPAHHGLGNAEQFLDVCSEIERGAILFGHVHRQYTLTLPELDAPLFNSGSATLLGREGLWLFDVQAGAIEARCGRWEEDRFVVDEPVRPTS